jgi:MFS family permease
MSAPRGSRYRWFVVFSFFLFILLHQSDKLLIGPLTTPIMETFRIDEAQMGFVFSGAVIVGAIFYPLWGYLYDRFVRAKLLSLAAFIWGATTWISALMRTFPGFLASRASTGIDDASYPGLYNLTADYFEPRLRGKVNGLLQLAMPLGYLAGMILALMLKDVIGWRGVFYITGSLGIAVALLLFLGVREPQRGGAEPELAGIAQQGRYRINWKVAKGLLRKPSLLLLIGNGFFGVFPWQVITYWFFRYLETDRGYNSGEILITMAVAVLVLASGYPVGGALGDALFKRTPRGRLMVAAGGVAIGAVLLFVTLRIPLGARMPFAVMLAVTALFIPFAAPNVVASVHDVALPETRSTALAILNFFEQIGSSVAPALAGLIAVRSTLGNAILVICISAWAVCFVFMSIASRVIPRDIAALRGELQKRAEAEKAGVAAGLPGGRPAEPGPAGAPSGAPGA